MVAPLIVGAARLAAGSVKGASKVRGRKLAGKSRRRSSDPSQPNTGHRAVPSSKMKNARLTLEIAQNVPGAEDLIRKGKAIAAGSFILWWIVPFYFIQIVFWIIGFAGLGLKALPIAGLLPWDVLFSLAYMVIALIGFSSILFALIVFIGSKVDYLSGKKEQALIVCLAGIFVIVINIIPFVPLWVLYVMFNQKKEEGEEA